MITLDLNIANEMKKVKIKDEILFNAILSEHPIIIKNLIKSIHRSYNISEEFFVIVNKYIDFTNEGVSIYPGLIIRTSLNEYAVLYLENTEIDEEYMIETIKEYIYDVGDFEPKKININKFEINKKSFLSAIKNI